MKKKLASLGILVAIAAMILLPAVLPAGNDAPGGRIVPSPAWPGLTPTAPILVTSDADWVALAASGSGTAVDPWILEDMLIECDYLSHGIIVMNTDDHFIIRDSYINESYGDLALGYGIGMQNASNGRIENVTIEHCQNGAIAVGADMGGDRSENVTIVGNTVLNVTNTAISVFDVLNTVVANNTMTNMTTGMTVSALWTTLSHDVAIMNNTITNSTESLTMTHGENVTVVDNSIRNGTWHHACITTSYNFTIAGNTFDFHNNIGVEIHGSVNFTIANNTVINNIKDENVYLADCSWFNVTGNQFLTGSGFIGSIALSDNCTDGLISGNLEDPRPWDCYAGITLGTSIVNVTIVNNTIYNATNHGAINLNGENIIVENNTFVECAAGVAGTESGIYVGHFDTVTNATVQNNTFRDYARHHAVHFTARDINMTITGNYFVNVSAYFDNDSTGDVQTWDSNYYSDYFADHPYAITANVSTSILEYEYVLDATMNDTRPMYAPWLYPRYEQVFFNFYSNVDGLGIPFTNLHVELDGTPLTITDPVIPYVLYHVVIEDFRGRALYDEVLNLNATGIYVNIGLDIAVMIYVSYSSTLDSFGFAFDLAKLYVDGVRTPIFNPIMDHEIINFVVRDFADRILYNQTWNLTATGVYIDIPLAVTTLVVHNKFDYGVIFHYEIAGIENSFPVDGGEHFEVRVAIGTYSWWITDTKGRSIDGLDGDEIDGSKSITGPNFVSFGWTSVVPPTPVVVTGATWVDLVWPVIIIVAIVEVLIRIPFKKTKKKAPSSTAARRH